MEKEQEPHEVSFDKPMESATDLHMNSSIVQEQEEDIHETIETGLPLKKAQSDINEYLGQMKTPIGLVKQMTDVSATKENIPTFGGIN